MSGKYDNLTIEGYTTVSNPVSTGLNSDIPIGFANSIRGGYHVYEDVLDMLLLYQNYRVEGMMVRLDNTGPRGEDPGWYVLNPGGGSVGPVNYIQWVKNSTLTIKQKNEGVTHDPVKWENTDDGSFWARMNIDYDTGEVPTVPPPSNPNAPNNDYSVRKYYHGSILGADIPLTETEVKSLTAVERTDMITTAAITNQTVGNKIPYIYIPLAWTNSTRIIGWNVGGIPTTPTETFYLIIDGEQYVGYRVSGTIAQNQVITIDNFVYNATSEIFIGGFLVDMSSLPASDNERYSIALDNTVKVWRYFKIE